MTEWPSKPEADRMLEEAMASLQQERRKLAELGKVWEESTTIRAKDQSLAMTFDGRGELTELTFRGEKYRTMAPAQLAATILETLRRGRAESVRRIGEVMGNASRAEHINSSQFDPLAMVDELIGPLLSGVDDLDIGGSRGEAAPKGEGRSRG